MGRASDWGGKCPHAPPPLDAATVYENRKIATFASTLCIKQLAEPLHSTAELKVDTGLYIIEHYSDSVACTGDYQTLVYCINCTAASSIIRMRLISQFCDLCFTTKSAENHFTYHALHNLHWHIRAFKSWHTE